MRVSTVIAASMLFAGLLAPCADAQEGLAPLERPTKAQVLRHTLSAPIRWLRGRPAEEVVLRVEVPLPADAASQRDAWLEEEAQALLRARMESEIRILEWCQAAGSASGPCAPEARAESFRTQFFLERHIAAAI